MNPTDSEQARSRLEVLPRRARLLHIGLMKTGTTALQRAASSRRRALLRAGVRYPGKHYNHRQAALALMNRPPSVTRTPDDAWTALLQEVEGDGDRRAWISNEFICGSDERTASRFLEDLGPRTHVVVTVRSVGAVLPSLWQQYVKTGWTQDFPAFLATVLAAPFDHDLHPPYHHRNDQGAVVARWAELVGAPNVTVVIVDKSEPRRVQSAFETLLGLPVGQLETRKSTGYAENRSLSAEEASLFLQVNRALPAGTVDQDDIIRVLQGGAMARVLDRPAPTSSDRIALPSWASRAASELGERYAATIAGTRVRVVGDLAELGQIPAQTGKWEPTDTISVEVAAEAVLGAFSAGLHRGSDFGQRKPAPVPTVRPTAARRAVRGLVRRARTIFALQ